MPKIPTNDKESAVVETGKNYTLDTMSFLVWVQCDGKTDLDSIVNAFSVNGNRDIVKAAISGVLDKLADKWA